MLLLKQDYNVSFMGCVSDCVSIQVKSTDRKLYRPSTDTIETCRTNCLTFYTAVS